MLMPSKLPENTVIEHHSEGRFIKSNGGLWVEVEPEYSKHSIIVSDKGFSNSVNRPANFVESKSDDYFENFKIIALPVTVSENLAAWFGSLDVEESLERAIEEVVREERDV